MFLKIKHASKTNFSQGGQVSAFGRKGVIFGSNWPYSNQKFEKIKIELANLSKNERTTSYGKMRPVF